MRLLLCDAHAMFLDGLAHALRERGHDVEVCEDPLAMEAAVAAVRPEATIWGMHGVAEEEPLTAFRASSVDTVLVLLVTTPSPASWELFDRGVVNAIVSQDCRVADLERMIQQAKAGRGTVLGVRRPATRPEPARLTERELHVLQLMADGASTQQMAHSLGLSTHTVRTHVHNVLRKLDAPRRALAVHRAEQLGLLTPRSVGLVV